MQVKRHKPNPMVASGFKKACLNKRRMKRRPTRGERRFKGVLKGLNLAFQAQRIFVDTQFKKSYIVDFYLPYYKLVFEIDGSSHGSKWQITYDDIRSSFLARKGIKVERLSNELTLNSQACQDLVNDIVVKRREVVDKRKDYWKKRDYIGLPQEEIDVESLKAEYLAKGGTIKKYPDFGYKRKFKVIECSS